VVPGDPNSSEVYLAVLLPVLERNDIEPTAGIEIVFPWGKKKK